ncbi:hypothetical protein [Arthrobacter sp. ISL-95]|uniref:hypothetical protein n=1 Tax=Arthrobacter sp. ISL-95 TaxID=2819116 RepID=UPI001BE8131D|nr:hypothetical protein [Arthrobacter sp. ISL-95]MBT2587334.1 hypothetical protein [Arthrobacter sp. ISL-95]
MRFRGRLQAGPRRVRHDEDKRKVLIELIGDQVTAATPYFVDFMSGLAGLLEGYTDDELRVIADYSARAAEVQKNAAARLGGKAHSAVPLPGSPA